MKYELYQSAGLEDFKSTELQMKRYVDGVTNHTQIPILWFLEYPPLYTMGVSDRGKTTDLPYPVYGTGRGGKTTYHGPGQRIAYFIHKLPPETLDIKRYVFFLEEWIIRTLQLVGIKGQRSKEGVGIWVMTNDGLKKIAAIGVRVQKWVTSHGVALNINPNLSHYESITPCGIQGLGVTSLHDLGLGLSMKEVDTLLLQTFIPTYNMVMKD